MKVAMCGGSGGGAVVGSERGVKLGSSGGMDGRRVEDIWDAGLVGGKHSG